MPSAWIDLSVPVVTGMPVYPGDPAVEVSPALRAPRDGVNVLQLHMGSQSGTHVDAPYHVDDAWPHLDELPLDRFAGHAVVADVRGLPPRAPVTPELLAPVLNRLRLRPGSLVALATGWSAYWAPTTTSPTRGSPRRRPRPSSERASARSRSTR